MVIGTRLVMLNVRIRVYVQVTLWDVNVHMGVNLHEKHIEQENSVRMTCIKKQSIITHRRLRFVKELRRGGQGRKKKKKAKYEVHTPPFNRNRTGVNTRLVVEVESYTSHRRQLSLRDSFVIQECVAGGVSLDTWGVYLLGGTFMF